MPAAEIRRSSARLRDGLTALVAILAALVVLERFSAVMIELYAHGAAHEPLQHLGMAAAAACPELFYLLALWEIRDALKAFARGEFFTQTIAAMLNRVGIRLAIGAAITVFALPTIDFMFGHSPGYFIAYDLSSITLGAVGLSLTVIGRVLRRAAELQTELDEMF